MRYPPIMPRRPRFPRRRPPLRRPPVMRPMAQPKKDEGVHFPVLGYVIAAVVVVVLLVLILTGGEGEVSVSGLDGFRDSLTRGLSGSITGAVTQSYALPEGYREVCFVDLSRAHPIDMIDNDILRASFVRNTGRNVFLFGRELPAGFFVEGISIESYPFYSCVRVTEDDFEIRVEPKDGEVFVKLLPTAQYCRNAQNEVTEEGDNLCEFLDEVYYDGYKGECCRNYGYCC